MSDTVLEISYETFDGPVHGGTKYLLPASQPFLPASIGTPSKQCSADIGVNRTVLDCVGEQRKDSLYGEAIGSSALSRPLLLDSTDDFLEDTSTDPRMNGTVLYSADERYDDTLYMESTILSFYVVQATLLILKILSLYAV